LHYFLVFYLKWLRSSGLEKVVKQKQRVNTLDKRKQKRLELKAACR
jgi:hypothetical protein